MKTRHLTESKTTAQFLKYALGNRSAVPSKNITFGKNQQSRSLLRDRSTLNDNISQGLPILSRKVSQENSVMATIAKRGLHN